MQSYFVVTYINTDEPVNSEVIGVYETKEMAIVALITAAHFEERDGELLQYKRPTTEYKSYTEIYDLVNENFELDDFDVYRIEEV
jgi:hypothetical protein